MKAMILAAGRGTRMRHLTTHTPKPLLKVGSHTLIEHNILRLAAAGITDIIINLAYHGDKIKKHLGDGHQFNVHIEYSEEGAQPLGPGGGIVQALPLLGKKHFIVLAADIWCDFPIQTLLNKTDHLAHMVMVRNPDFHSTGDYGIRNGFLTHDAPKLTYASISVWHPAVFTNHSADECVGLPVFINKIVPLQAITAEEHQGDWYNIGTPEQLQFLTERMT